MKDTLDLGAWGMTSGIDAKCRQDKAFRAFLMNSIIRHLYCDWGEIDPEDKYNNDMAMDTGCRNIVSRYKDSETGYEIFIITEPDEARSTIYLPDEM